jgi:predicted dehydrogenase
MSSISVGEPARTTVTDGEARESRPAPADIQPLAPPGAVAVIGAGGFGRFCVDAYRQSGDIHVVAVTDPQFAGERLNGWSALRIEADWRTAICHPEVEVVHLATPPFLRGEIVIEALLAGKSVLCEKPLALSLDEADDMLRTAEQTSRTVSINYVLRHHPAFHVLYRLAQTDLFGSVKTIALQNFAQNLPHNHWMWDERKSGGILVEHGVHFFDAYGQLVGAPSAVRASAPRPHAAEATVQYAMDAVGLFYHDFSFPPSIERTRGIVFFERGYVEIDGWIPEQLHGAVLCDPEAFEDMTTALGLVPAVPTGDAFRFRTSFGERQAAYRRAIVDGMRETVTCHRDPSFQLTVSPKDARASLALSLAGQRAIHTGRIESPE